jgi:hypothetical protein
MPMRPVEQQEQGPTVLVFADANSRDTYFTVHAIGDAQALTKGSGTKVGILDHSFGVAAHKDLYAGAVNFQDDCWGSAFETAEGSHGYWMALVLREIAPEVEVYALGTSSEDEANRVRAMVKAIDWAIEHQLDAITYSAERFAPALRQPLDEAVQRAVAHGIVVTFIHYPHPDNLLPTGLLGPSGDDEREPDVHVYHNDYTVLFVEWYQQHQAGKQRPGWRPFLSVSSTAPVTAGVVAMMRSVNPALTPAECKAILMQTARPMEYGGVQIPRVIDAPAAVKEAASRIE